MEGFDGRDSEVEVGSAAEARGSVQTLETVRRRLMEMLCDEAGFVIEEKTVKVIDEILDENDRIPFKTGILFTTLGIDEKDAPKLFDFMIKYGQSKPSCSTDEAVTSDPIDQNDVLEALTCFLDRRHKQERDRGTLQVQSLEVQDASKVEAEMRRLRRVILRAGNTTEERLKRQYAVLSKISDLNQEIQNLKQEKAELQKRKDETTQ